VNVNPSGIKALFDRWNMPEGMMLQEQADQIRKIFQATPMIAAMKRTAAEHSGHADWARVRPPLCALGEEAAASLRRALGAVGFGMEGYPR
jgi:4-hydroxy-tetrahydrodipicolinate synthase